MIPTDEIRGPLMNIYYENYASVRIDISVNVASDPSYSSHYRVRQI